MKSGTSPHYDIKLCKAFWPGFEEWSRSNLHLKTICILSGSKFVSQTINQFSSIQ